MRRATRKQRGGSMLPNTTWGQWADFPGALAWGPGGAQAPLPLANGGLYTNPQSTGSWASSPFPATQYAMAVESARVSGNPDVFYHQRIADNGGASFSPYVHTPISSQHTVSVMRGGKRRSLGHKRRRRNTRKHK